VGGGPEDSSPQADAGRERVGKNVPVWPVRNVPAALRERYVQQGWWTDDTLAHLVDESLRAAPGATVRVWSDVRPWHGTYADVHTEALRLVAALRAAGLEPGDVIAFQLPNWREAVVAFYALAMGGYVLVPIVHIYGHKEVRFILGESHARAYISAGSYGHVDYVELVDGTDEELLPDLMLHVVVGNAVTASPRVRRVAWDDFTAVTAAGTIATPDPDDVCVLAYTSGTTSDPKGVIHTHRTLLAEMLHMKPMISAASTNLMGSPVTHATGMLGAVLGPMALGRAIHLIDRWDPDRVLDIMLEADIGAGTGASVFLASLMNHPNFSPEHATRMPRIGLGGAPVPVSLGEQAEANGITIIRAYGSTEHPSVTSGEFDDPAAKRHGTDGRARIGVEIRLVDGEIWSRGPDLCAGYTDPELTKRAFDADGWYHTGDVGMLDADGFLTITDRVNDVIIRGGENISAAEVENALDTLPEIAEVAVVAAPDARLGEHACAVVRLATGTGSIDLATITAHLERVGLARQKWPEEVRVVDDFPRTAAGKVRKVDLRRDLRADASR
jgi:acyl-CoA synthetase (AMP-forming)/AMP-acid ligase II